MRDENEEREAGEKTGRRINSMRKIKESEWKRVLGETMGRANGDGELREKMRRE